MGETGPSFQPSADRSEADVTGVFLAIGSRRADTCPCIGRAKLN